MAVDSTRQLGERLGWSEHHPEAHRAVQRLRADPQWLQVLTTEHFALQTARSATIVEANGRTQLFVSALAGAIVASAFIAQTQSLGLVFRSFVLLAFPVVLWLGVATFVRVIETAIQDLVYVRAINRLRQLYAAAAPELAPYFGASIHEYQLGVSPSLSSRGPGWERGFLSSAGTIEVIDSMVAGAIAAVLAQLGSPSVPLTAATGGAAFFATLVAHHAYQSRRWQRVRDAAPA